MPGRVFMRSLQYFLVLATTLLVGAPAARAAGSTRTVAGTGWAIVTTSKGCIAYINPSYETDEVKSITWSGECQSGQPITGTGTMTFLFVDGRRAFTGPVVAGYWHGIVKLVGSSNPLPHNMGCLEPVDRPCHTTRPSQVAGIKPMAPEIKTTIEDLEVCRPEIEEAHRLRVADQRRIIADHAARAQRAGSAESVKWYEDKRQSSQRHLDEELRKDPMEQYVFMLHDRRRSEVIDTTRTLETEVRLLREDPGSDQIRNTVGVTFTRETAEPRIAFQVARLCTLKVRLALEPKPRAKSK